MIYKYHLKSKRNNEELFQTLNLIYFNMLCFSIKTYLKETFYKTKKS